MSYDENDLENYLNDINDTDYLDDIIRETLQTIGEEGEETGGMTLTHEENTAKGFIENMISHGPGETREEQQDIKIRDACQRFHIPVQRDAVIGLFSSKYKDMYHLLNPIICIHAYIKLYNNEYKNMSIPQYCSIFQLSKEQGIDIIRYMRKYSKN